MTDDNNHIPQNNDLKFYNHKNACATQNELESISILCVKHRFVGKEIHAIISQTYILCCYICNSTQNKLPQETCPCLFSTLYLQLGVTRGGVPVT